jgi:hypothetical protein
MLLILETTSNTGFLPPHPEGRAVVCLLFYMVVVLKVMWPLTANLEQEPVQQIPCASTNITQFISSENIMFSYFILSGTEPVIQTFSPTLILFFYMTTLMQYIFYRNASGIFCIAHALSNCCT